MVTYKNTLGNVKVTVDGVDAKGKPTHSEWSGKIDGKDYPVTGDPISDARSYTKVNDRTMDFAVKKGGKTTITGRIVVAADGKSRTVTTSGTDPKRQEGQQRVGLRQAVKLAIAFKSINDTFGRLSLGKGEGAGEDSIPSPYSSPLLEGERRNY